jgi:hypothetical protein
MKKEMKYRDIIEKIEEAISVVNNDILQVDFMDKNEEFINPEWQMLRNTSKELGKISTKLQLQAF